MTETAYCSSGNIHNLSSIQSSQRSSLVHSSVQVSLKYGAHMNTNFLGVSNHWTDKWTEMMEWTVELSKNISTLIFFFIAIHIIIIME